LTNPVSANFLPDEKYMMTVFSFIGNARDENYENELLKLLERKRFSNVFNADATALEQFGQKKYFRTRASTERIWILYTSIINQYRTILNEFVGLRDVVEKALLIGDYPRAEESLRLVKEKFGESLWYIRNLILVLSYQGRSEELHSLCGEWKDRSPDKLFRYIINCFQLISDSDNASLRLKNLVQTYVDEFSEGNQTGAASLLSLVFIPSPLKGDAAYLESLEIIQIFPIVDQYIILLQWLQYAIVDTLVNGQAVFSTLNEVVGKMLKSVNDPILRNMYSSLNGNASGKISEQGLSLLKSYTDGAYNDVIENFNSWINDLENPVAYLNLVAKAHAYSNKSIDTSAKSVLQRMISDLTVTYKLAPGRKQSEDSVISTIIKHRGSIYFPHLQMCLYAAAPLHFDAGELNRAGKFAFICSAETTPLVYSLSRCDHEGGGRRYSDANDISPTYRKLKHEITIALDRGVFSDNLASKLATLAQTARLKKDFLELHSEYCLAFNRISDLLSTGASALSADPNSYICFPMEYMLNEIENSRIASVEAVIVAYYYVRNISTKREYVLNEAFEEYILSQNVTRPSEILIRISEPNALQAFFFREICSPEIMDFLSCFDNSNELRAERVRLLDLLLERNLVSSGERMREVEKIVGQVIIDAGTSEFNRAKIFVDELSIWKHNADELGAIFSIYQQAKDEGDDRITLLNDISNSDALTTYVSGGKNSLVTKVFNILQNGFLYDEMHGFDKNLSTEIRHGFFSNLMRARLQERNLITEIDEAGEYKSNEFWENANSFIPSRLWELIDGHLRLFSASFNALVAEAEEWMKIGDGQDSGGMFVYHLSLTDFLIIKQSMERSSDMLTVASLILSMLWTQTELGLIKIRERINVDFRDRIDGLFDALAQSVIETKGTIAAVGLMNSIAHARDEIKEDITTVAEWFQRDKSPGMEGRLLNYVVEIAISSFEEVKASGIAIEKNISEDLRQLKISSKAVRSFIIAITNLLDNCYRRSGLGQLTRVQIDAVLLKNGAQITIKNDVSTDQASVLTVDVITEIDKKIRSPESLDFMRTEGGSGISKAYNEIASLSEHSDLRLDFSENYFLAIITYEI
jgi:hypothetical protein